MDQTNARRYLLGSYTYDNRTTFDFLHFRRVIEGEHEEISAGHDCFYACFPVILRMWEMKEKLQKGAWWRKIVSGLGH